MSSSDSNKNLGSIAHGPGDSLPLIGGEKSEGSPFGNTIDQQLSVFQGTEKAMGEQELVTAAADSSNWHVEELFGRMKDNDRRVEILGESFPSVRASLEQAASRFGENIALEVLMASRHVLCAEALTEVLEKRIREGNTDDSDANAIGDEYYARAVEKIKLFAEREPDEREKIEDAYALAPGNIALACDRGLIPWDSAPGYLEELVEYGRLLVDLAAHEAPPLPPSPQL